MADLNSLLFKPSSSAPDRISRFLMGGPDLSEGLTKETTEVFSEVAEELLLPALRDKLEENESVFTGTLRDSLRVYATEKTVQIVSDTGYARLLEKGSDGRVVTDAEYEKMPEWVLHKKLVRPGDTDTAQLVADRIVDQIQEQGTEPHPFVAPVIEELRPVLEERAQRKLIIRLRG